MYSLRCRSFSIGSFGFLHLLVPAALAERVKILDDTFIELAHSSDHVEVEKPPFVLGGELPVRMHPNYLACFTLLLSSLDDFSFAMDVEVALPLGNIGDEPEACGTGLGCAAPEYVAGNSRQSSKSLSFT
jgi:hypothetical protein